MQQAGENTGQLFYVAVETKRECLQTKLKTHI